MAWDIQETRRRLQQAACAEFTVRGPDGTTMARIAALAEINKERLYDYFRDKPQLFETVLVEELEKLAVSLGMNAPGLEDIHVTGLFVPADVNSRATCLDTILDSNLAVGDTNRLGLWPEIHRKHVLPFRFQVIRHAA